MYSVVYFRYINIGEFTILGIILGNLVANALPEELVKFVIIKKSKPTNEIDIMKNLLLISVIFMFFENYMYSQNGILVGCYRMFMPIHLITQMIMAHYMIKSYHEEKSNKMVKLKYLIFSILVPIIIHTAYNSFINIVENAGFVYMPIFVIILGIITYILTYKFVKNGIKKYSTMDNDEIENYTISKAKLFTIIIVIVFWLFTYRL